jgi:hypothetical protein
MKLHFAYEGAVAEFGDWGQYETDVESSLPHRFELVDGVVVDKYDGVSDNEVKRIDYDKAVQDRLDFIETLEEGQEVPPEFPPFGLGEDA